MCEHKRLKYVGHRGETRVFCANCGKELDKTFLEGKTARKTRPSIRGRIKPRRKRHAQKRPFNGEIRKDEKA